MQISDTPIMKGWNVFSSTELLLCTMSNEQCTNNTTTKTTKKRSNRVFAHGNWAPMQTALIIATVYLNWSNKYYLINYADLSLHLAALLEFANRLQITLAIGFQLVASINSAILQRTEKKIAQSQSIWIL